MEGFRIARAENDLLFDESGRSYIDLFSGHGTTWLGHGHPAVVKALGEQLARAWITGGIDTAVGAEAKLAIESFFPASHRVAQLCSTGMEAAEFAMRLARATTGRNRLIGFSRGMHGKSLATSRLGWDNGDGIRLPDVVRLPFVAECAEEEVLAQLRTALEQQPAAAVFVEPIQACGGGHRASPEFYQEVHRLCSAHQTLLVFDELLTGFYRTGPAFFFSDLGFVPDVVLVGKGIGNGFPVAGVVANERHAVTPAMLPGSTFAGNPLAAAAVRATLHEIRALDMAGRVAAVAKSIVEALGTLDAHGFRLRGRGALWIVELPGGMDARDAVVACARRGAVVGQAGPFIRLMPAATIVPEHLDRACAIVREELLRRAHEST